MRVLFLLLLSFLSSNIAFSQSSITGRLLDQDKSSAVEYASVALYQQSDSSLITGVISQADGSFIIENLKPGSYYLVAQFMGYDNSTVGNFQLSWGQALDLGAINMAVNQKLLDEIMVEEEKVTTMHKVDRQVYEVNKFQSGRGGNAVDLLRNLPSVAVNANGDISARGSSGFTVLINGSPVQSDPATILAQLPANAIQNIELITAPSAKYDPEGKAGICQNWLRQYRGL